MSARIVRILQSNKFMKGQVHKALADSDSERKLRTRDKISDALSKMPVVASLMHRIRGSETKITAD